MAKANLNKMSLTELKRLEKDVAKAIESHERRARAEAKAAAESAAKKHGFSLNQLIAATPKASKPALPPKYRHPENSAKTWSGRGRKPGWINDGLAAGKSLDDFLIK